MIASSPARSGRVKAWAIAEDAPHLKARGIDELEHFRLAFHDRSYFFV